MKLTHKLAAGFIATIPMTFIMINLFKKLPEQEKYPLPPRVISMNVAQTLGLRKNLTEKERLGLTYVNHFLYGAIVACLYFPLAKKIKIHNQISGMLYGLLVWGGNYIGMLPALKLYPPVTKEPLERSLLMIISHLVWGSTLGAIKSLREVSH